MKHLILITLIFISSVDSTEWKLRKDRDGIKIFTRSIEGSDFDEFKGICTLENCTLHEVLAILLDVNNYDKLYPDCTHPKILKQNGKYHDIHYIIITAPWPIQNRDAIYEMNTVISDDGRHALVSMLPRPDYIKPKDDLFRIQKGSGFWELIEKSDYSIAITYQFHGEPGGNIPAWLANSFVVKHPLKTIQNLQNLLEK
jgi:hypothetical protein